MLCILIKEKKNGHLLFKINKKRKLNCFVSLIYQHNYDLVIDFKKKKNYS